VEKANYNRRPGNTNAQKHGTDTLKRAVKVLGRRYIDQRTIVGKALAAWRGELLLDLGGIEAVSTQELALVEEAVKTKLILDSVDAWLLTQPTLIAKRTRGVLPAVRDRQALVSTLRGLLSDLGLKRRGKTMPSLGEYLAAKGNGGGAGGAPSDERAGSKGIVYQARQNRRLETKGEHVVNELAAIGGRQGGEQARSPAAGAEE
jgi:hypothetical protein